MKLFVLCFALVLSILSVRAEEKQECEVCVKVINDLKELANTKLDKPNNDNVASLIDEHCAAGKKNMNRKDGAICYNILPMKGDVAKQIVYKKDSLKICKSLSKKNPDFCTIRYPVKTDKNTEYGKLRIKQLKNILSDRGVECTGCLEKSDYVKRCKETEHMEL